MIDALIQLILREQHKAARTGNRLIAVYIGQEEAERVRDECRGLSGWVRNVRHHKHENDPDFIVCSCPVYVLQRVKNHVGICVNPER